MVVEAVKEANVRPLPGSDREDVTLLELVCGNADAFENSVGIEFRERNDRFYNQYRGFRKFADVWDKAGPNDRDAMIFDAKKHWGAHLHIPLSFRTIETMVPRAIAQRPKMLYKPRLEQWAENVESVRTLIDAQQQNISIDLPFQAVMRSGRIYGIGVGKVYWRKDYATYRPVRRGVFKTDKWFASKKLAQRVTFDDPTFEDVDVYDFMWDPYASDIETAGWVIHRTWLSTQKCLDRVQSGAWNTPSAKLLTPKVLEGMGGGQRFRYDEVWQNRMMASGFSQIGRGGISGDQPHEVLEWHDGSRVLTVIDRQVCVQDAENPCLGHKPFMAYRPTPLQRQMVGIGDLEPIEHLQRELDTLRSQRRDAATMALVPGFAFDDGLVDEDDIVFGPRALIRVTNGRPTDALYPLPVRDVPGAGYQEESVIKQDMDVVSGIQDESPGQVTTATEAQLVQADLSRRIQMSSRRFELEVVRPAARAFLYLNQRMILSERDPIAVPEDGVDEATALNEGRWKWFPITPDALRGEFSIIPEGGSMAQRNIPQDRQDAQTFFSLASNPAINGRRATLKGLELLGIEQPQAWLTQKEPPIPPVVFENLARMGVDPSIISAAISAAQQEDPSLPTEEQGPNVDQFAAMMGGGQ